MAPTGGDGMGRWTTTGKATVCAVALLAAGCGSDERTVETEAGAVTVRTEDEGVRVSGTTEEGAAYEGTFGEGSELPTDFPDDVPLFPDAKVTGSMSVAEEGRMVKLRAEAGGADVLAFYRRELEAQGWQIEAEMDLGGQRMLTAGKDERIVSVQILGGDGGTDVMLTVAEPD